MDINPLLAILLGAGGTGGLVGLVNVWRTIKSGKIADEETIINRQLKEISRAEIRVNECERSEERMRRQRNSALDQAAHFRRMLIEVGVPNIPALLDYRDYEENSQRKPSQGGTGETQ